MKISSIVGLSTRSMRSAFPSRPNFISSNFPVSKIESVISLNFSAFIRSPSPSGITAKTLPAETLCNPEILISSITHESSS